MTQTEYADYRRVSRQAISKLVKSGKIPASAFIERNGRRLIDPVAADFALGESRERILSADGGQTPGEDDELSLDLGVDASSPLAPQSNSEVVRLTRARADSEEYKSRTIALEYEQKIGRLLQIEDVTRAMERCAAVIVREIDGLPDLTEDLLSAASEGPQVMRLALKKIAFNIRAQLEKSMRVAALEDDAAAPTEELS